MTTPIIPGNWSPQEALAVYDFIDMLRDAIWDQHGIQLQEILQAEQNTNPSEWKEFRGINDDPDDELNF
ncbi:MAG: hypothetical protein OCU12_08085 [Methanophagales archaeon]|nr:hypothetical protein [Methanophagales archaeon]